MTSFSVLWEEQGEGMRMERQDSGMTPKVFGLDDCTHGRRRFGMGHELIANHSEF